MLPTLFCFSQPVYRLAAGWMVRGSNPGGGEIFRTRPDWPLGKTQPPIEWVPCFFSGVNGPGRDHPFPSSTEKERTELYLCFPSGPSWTDGG